MLGGISMRTRLQIFPYNTMGNGKITHFILHHRIGDFHSIQSVSIIPQISQTPLIINFAALFGQIREWGSYERRFQWYIFRT